MISISTLFMTKTAFPRCLRTFVMALVGVAGLAGIRLTGSYRVQMAVLLLENMALFVMTVSLFMTLAN